MRRVMRDDLLEAQFQLDGYVEIPFINKEEVAALLQKFYDTLPKSGGQITAGETGVEGAGFITYDFTFIDKNIEYKKEVFKIITEYFAPHVEKWLADYKPIIANYIRKKSDTGEVPLHQNWAFADEKKVCTVSIWCPLVDSFKENGTLQIVPGSHKRFGEVRGPMIPWELEGIKKEIIADHLVPMNIKAGTAIVLDDSIVHYSAINATNDLRLAIQLILIPGEEPSIHYHMNPSQNAEDVNVLEVDHEFYMQFNPWKQPEGAKLVKTFKHQSRQIDIAEFKLRMNQPRYDEPVRTKSFVEKLRAVFS